MKYLFHFDIIIHKVETKIEIEKKNTLIIYIYYDDIYLIF